MKGLLITILFTATTLFGQVMGPKIFALEKEFDFGTVEQGEIVLHDYTITNNGDDVLVINRVRASCGCTAAKPDKNELKPGESTTIHVEFNSRNRKGRQKKYIYIYTNDPNSPEYRLKLTGEVLMTGKNASAKAAAVLKLEKTQHNFGKIKEGDVVSVTIRFKNTGEKPLEIRDVKSSCGCTAAILSSRSLKPNEEGKIRIEFDSSGRSGNITRTVTLISNDKKHPKQTITIFANIEK